MDQDQGDIAPAAGPPDAAVASLGAETISLLDTSAVPALLVATTGDNPIVFANAALLDLTGFERMSLLGRPAHTLLSRHGDRSAWASFQNDLDAGRPVAIEMLGARRDGTTYWGAMTFGPIPGGRAACRLGQIVDISRRKDVEDALLLSQQREALGLITNSVAHEFNNFLQILIGYIDGLKRRLADRPEPFVQRAVTRSTEAAERAAVLTRQLLTYSRRIAPEVRPVDLDALVETTVGALRRIMPEGVQIAFVPAGELPPALCNPTQVDLALRHVVANAVEALDGVGRIELATFAVPPGDRTLQRPSDGAVGIAIADHGHGMSPEMMSRALAPFATSREAGRGVGLAIVHGLMKRQNGTISLDSRPGEGTTVRLVFPSVG